MKTIDLLQMTVAAYVGMNRKYTIAASDVWTAELIKKAILDHTAHNHNLTDDRLNEIATCLLNGVDGFDGNCTYFDLKAIPKMD